MAKQGLQHANWTFTFNYGNAGQPTKEDVLIFWDSLSTKAHYAVAGFETAPTTGQRHLQGYVQLDGKLRLTQLKKLDCALTVCWFPARGDEQDNEAYCTKEGGEILRCGDEPRVINAGKRVKRDYGRAIKLAREQEMETLRTDLPQMYLQYYRSLEDIQKRSMATPEPLSHTTKHLWLYGPTGTGKSRSARDLFQRLGLSYCTKLHNKWFSPDNRNSEALLIDDLGLETGRMLVNYLKQWLDIYAFSAEFKGGLATIRPELYVITSNYHPHEMFGGTSDYDPIMRRLEVIYLGPPGGEYEAPSSSSGAASLAGVIGSSYANQLANVLDGAKRARPDLTKKKNPTTPVPKRVRFVEPIILETDTESEGESIEETEEEKEDDDEF